jgi:hypothetical protein
VTEGLERVLRVAAPVLALTTVALALRWGAPSPLRAAIVKGSPPANAGTGLAWQVLAIDESHGAREPVVGMPMRAVARQGTEERDWSGTTNRDGVAEMSLGLARPEGMHLEVYAGGDLLASGEVAIPGALVRRGPGSPWARPARRDGPILLDVAVLGQRAASGFPASIWVRATDEATRHAAAGVTIEPEKSGSFVPASPTATTDARGWAEVVATPWGHAVSMFFHARAADGRTGDWAGALIVSPGAPEVRVPARVVADEAPVVEVVTHTTRPTAYIEVVDAQGRAWAGSLAYPSEESAASRVVATLPRLAPGLYWAIADDSPAGASELAPGTAVRPFFVAASDDAALAFGRDAAECAPPSDIRATGRALSVCLALAPAPPAPRWVALEGFSERYKKESAKRSKGVAFALVAIVSGAILEALLLVRAAMRARARLRVLENAEEGAEANFVTRGWVAVMVVLVAMLGFAMLAAFVARMR